MLVVAGVIVGFVVVVILSLAVLKPDDLHVERSILIIAPPKAIFHLVNNLKAWEAWTSYDRDPGMKRNYSGPVSGLGATYAWDGNSEAGQGNIIITKSAPCTHIYFELNMVSPLRGRNKVVFSLRPVREGTEVVWALDDKTPFAGKLMSLFVDLDGKIGGDFEIGLNRLKDVAEAPVPWLRDARAW